MSTEKKYTERDLVLAKREGYVKGRNDGEFGLKDIAAATARVLYPLPKVTRPRRLDYGKTLFEVRDGKLFSSSDGGETWYKTVFRNLYGDEYFGNDLPKRDRLLALADLLANPTEEVEDA